MQTTNNLDIKNARQHIEADLKELIEKHSYQNFFHEIYDYSLLPAGKLFRPLLAYATAMDFGINLDNKDAHNSIKSFSCALEIHHTYTLIHDDMPCMDDDQYRRGRLSTHAKFGQWQALLAGDALHGLSFNLINKIKCNNKYEILNYAHWCLGAKGLILGQALDLDHQMTESFENLVLTHKLKTARLIQLAIVGAYLQTENTTFQQAKALHRLGHHMGVAFQLLDDLCELEDEKLSEHESAVNPWLTRQTQCFNELKRNLEYQKHFFEKYGCENLRFVYGQYLGKILSIIENSKETIISHLSQLKNEEDVETAQAASLDPIISLLNTLTL
ncbi:polyprenyl synthetase family protein [Halobacteriovorax sp. YZS-1-1]|uniref:polyprenyl synthetase family protein n=1 Tax=unclassified Halobacteriovorax TaxID=2639665 RepID=UPI00399A6CE9